MDAVFFAVSGANMIVGIAAIMIMLLIKKGLRTQIEEVQRKMDFFDEKTNRVTRALVDRLDRTYSDTMSALQVVDEDLDTIESKLEQDDDAEPDKQEAREDDLQTMVEHVYQSSQDMLKRLDEIEENMSERIALLRASLMNAQQEQAADQESLPERSNATDEQLYTNVQQIFTETKGKEHKTVDQLSRDFGVEYARMARTIDLLEQDGVVERVDGKGEYQAVVD